MKAFSFTGLVLSVCAAVGCNSSGGGGGGRGGGGGGGGGDLDGGVYDLSQPFDRDAACAMVSADGTLVKKPVDIIFVIDNSGSMTDEIIAVQNNLNTNFAQIIANSGLDYRIIMVSTHGKADPDESICISQPLSGHMCNPPPATPVNGPRYFHYSTEIASTDSFRKILSTYNAPDPFGLAPMGWSRWLRDGAIKVFVEITDDNEATSYSSFDTQLLALTPKQFGDATNRNYIFHAITGLAAKTVATDAYQPTEPIVTTKCPTGVNPGQQYQELAKMTGGLRFPVCDPSKFNTVFQAIAMGVVQGAQVACEFQVPTVPPPASVNLSTVTLDYTPSNGGPTQTFQQVPDAASCGAGKFYIQNNDRIVLCPDTCTVVKGDVMAKVKVFFECSTPVN